MPPAGLARVGDVPLMGVGTAPRVGEAPLGGPAGTPLMPGAAEAWACDRAGNGWVTGPPFSRRWAARLGWAAWLCVLGGGRSLGDGVAAPGVAATGTGSMLITGAARA